MTYILVLIAAGSFAIAPSTVPRFDTPKDCIATGEAWVAAVNQTIIEGRASYVCLPVKQVPERRRPRPKAKR